MRDTRSVEPNRGEKKPPINSRNMSNNCRLPSNFESLPPRLQRKHLAECGLPEDYLEKQQQQYKKEDNNSYNNQGYNNNNNRQSQQQNWSQTLPMPPKGRSARDGGGIYRNQYKDDYSSGAGGGGGGAGRSRSRSSDRRHDEGYFQKPRSRNPSNDKQGGGDGGGLVKNWRYDNNSSQQPPAPQQQSQNFNNNSRFQNQRKSFQKVDTRNMESVETIEKNLKSSSMVKLQQQQQQQHHQKQHHPQKQHLQPSADMMVAKQKSPGREDEMLGKQGAFEISYFVSILFCGPFDHFFGCYRNIKPNK
jgi:hypothetical protein